jgi:hypothetical protein
MPISNNPDVRLAEEWLEELEAWLAEHRLAGFDPFDVKQHPWIRAAQPYPLWRKATTALCDLFPHTARRLLGTERTENPKAHALVALGHLRLQSIAKDAAHLDHAGTHLDWLLRNAAPGHAGLCWGYPFDVSGAGVHTPRNTPVGVICAIAGDAFLHAHALTGDATYLDHARSVAEFMLRGLPRIEAEDGTWCFGYTPSDRRRVHNANLLVAEHLMRTWAVTKEDELRAAAGPALEFTLARQREDGAWPYGEHAPGEPFEEGLMRLVDNHHTGFVLRSLYGIYKTNPDERVRTAIEKGYKYYGGLFTPAGMPVTAQGAYPVDIHACAEGILCPSMLSDLIPGSRALAVMTLRWTWYYMREGRGGVPRYRKYPFGASRIAFPRWSVAWMYRALAEYMVHFHAVRERVDGTNLGAPVWLR